MTDETLLRSEVMFRSWLIDTCQIKLCCQTFYDLGAIGIFTNLEEFNNKATVELN